MGRRSAKKAEDNARRAQEEELARANAEAAARERELEEENRRIFNATKPLEQSAAVEYGLQGRGDMGSYSDNFGTGAPTDFGFANGIISTPEKDTRSTDIIMDPVVGNNPWFKLMGFGVK